MTNTNTGITGEVMARETVHHTLRTTWLDFRPVRSRLVAEFKQGEALTFSVVAFIPVEDGADEAAFSMTIDTMTADAWTDWLTEARDRSAAGILREQSGSGGWMFLMEGRHAWVSDATFDQMLEFASDMAGRDAAMAAHPAGKGRV